MLCIADTVKSYDLVFKSVLRRTAQNIYLQTSLLSLKQRLINSIQHELHLNFFGLESLWLHWYYAIAKSTKAGKGVNNSDRPIQYPSKCWGRRQTANFQMLIHSQYHIHQLHKKSIKIN